jgi:hypothetical protein
MITDLLRSAGPLINQSLSAAIATITASFFLYGLFKDIRNRVARAFSLLLFFVLITYIGDIGVTYADGQAAVTAWLRFQWFGIAFVPAAYAHLSHAILTMTGLESRGRRILATRVLYVLAVLFLVLVLFSDVIVRGLVMEPAPHFQPGPVFWLFVAYFVGAVVVSLWFVVRARRRTLTGATRRRMSYLLVPYLAPALSVFPFLLVSGEALSSPLAFYGVLILADFMLAIMLTFMAYAMAFLGTLMPGRLIKARLLQFFLRGPVVAIVVLAMIVWVPRAGAVLGLPGDEAMPLLVVAVILSLQWAITLARPYLERWLIYVGDYGEIRRIQELEQRLLTGADFRQLLDTILTVICDYLRIKTAFVASLTPAGPRLERAIALPPNLGDELESAAHLSETARNGDMPHPEDLMVTGDVFNWQGFWLIPLHARAEGEAELRLVGLLGIQAPADSGHALDDHQRQVLMGLAARAAEVLEDRRVQSEVFASLEGLLPEMTALEHLRQTERRGGVEALAVPNGVSVSPDFTQKVKDALGHYWGGPRLTDTSLMGLAVVRQALDENDGNPQRAMRAVLQQAIESLRPEGQRSMTTAEWILYNILDMRFIQGRKVRDVALRLAMSESDLYRKQRIAIEAVAAIIADMEQAMVEGETAAAASPDRSG